MTTSARLGDVAQINPRLNRRPPSDEAVSFLGMAGVDAETGTTAKGENRTFSTVAKGYTHFRNRDILLAKITPCFENGKIAQASLTHEIGVGSTEFHVIRPDPIRLDARFALHLLRGQDIRLAGEKRMTGSGGQRRVPQAYIENISVPLPPIEEQQRIAAILDHADVLRAKCREALAHLEDLTQSVFLEMFGDPFSKANCNRTRSLLDWVDNARPITYGILMPGDDVAGGVKYVRVVDMKQGQIDSDSVRRTSVEISNQYKRSLLVAGDILMSIRGHVGRLAIVPEQLHGANITQDTARYAVQPLSSWYVMECLRTKQMQRWMQQRTKGMAVKGINLTDLKLLPIPEPPERDQREFGRRAREIQNLKMLKRQQLASLDALFASLQQRAFSGAL